MKEHTSEKENAKYKLLNHSDGIKQWLILDIG